MLLLLFCCLTSWFCRLAIAALPPSIDPFYRPPADFASNSPGTVLRQRAIIAANLGLVPEPVQATQLLYRTRSVNGSAIATVTTIFKPYNARTDRFVSFQVAEDSAWVGCAPSYNFQFGAVTTNPIVTFENVLIQAYLAAGYIVVAPDYEGPDAAFAAGRLEGYGVLDGMRAASQFLGGMPAIVGNGYSGGAIATGWAASLQPTYAPELNIKGWSFGGTPANLTGTLVFLDDTVFSGFLPAAIDGLNKPSSYGTLLDPIIQQIVTPYGASRLAIANVNCAPTDLLTFAGQSILSYNVQTLGPDLPYQPTVAYVLSQQIMGRFRNETPTAPVFLYHAALDEIIPHANATTLFQSWCGFGASVHFTTFASGGHLTTEILGLVPAIQFADAAFAEAVPQGCSSDIILDPAVDPLALGLDVEPALIEAINTLIRLGPNDENAFQLLAVNGALV